MNKNLNSLVSRPSVEIVWGKITPISQRDPYPDLSQFCSQLRERGGYHLFAQHKRTANFYRLIFIGLSLLFLVLMAVILLLKVNVFFAIGVIAKTLLSGVCGLFAVITFALGWRIRADREVVHHLCRKSKAKLRNVYKRKKAKFGWHGLLIFLGTHKPATQVKQAYHEAVDKIHDSKEQTLNVLDQVISAGYLTPVERDSLCHQAILRLRDQLSLVINAFSPLA